MYKNIIAVLLILFIDLTFSCKKKEKIASETKIKDTQTSVAELQQIVTIFKGFEEIVEKNRDKPVQGVKDCTSYAKENIPKIKKLEAKVKTDEKTPEYIKYLLKTNDEIKGVGDRVTKIVTESYGVEGADVLLQLSDMALARL